MNVTPISPNVHTLPSDLLGDEVTIALVGCGGTGSRLLTGLAEFNAAMTALGHPGIRVTVFEDDLVSEANVGRQAFYMADVGLPKATVLMHRVNLAFGLNWDAVCQRFGKRIVRTRFDIVIGAVDSRASRRALHEYVQGTQVNYWLDLGNTADTAQFILGEPLSRWQKAWDRPNRLPTITDLFPDILDESIAEDDTPSCSMAEALERQELFTNRCVADAAMNLLWRLFRYGRIDHHGGFLNLRTSRMTPLPCDKDAWKRFGYVVKGKPGRKKKAA